MDSGRLQHLYVPCQASRHCWMITLRLVDLGRRWSLWSFLKDISMILLFTAVVKLGDTMEAIVFGLTMGFIEKHKYAVGFAIAAWQHRIVSRYLRCCIWSLLKESNGGGWGHLHDVIDFSRWWQGISQWPCRWVSSLQSSIRLLKMRHENVEGSGLIGQACHGIWINTLLWVYPMWWSKCLLILHTRWWVVLRRILTGLVLSRLIW